MNDSLIIRPAETPLLQSPFGGLNQRVDRRSFIQAMITSAVACFFLPGAMRRWKSLWVPSLPEPLSSKEFAQFLLAEMPRYEEIIRDITPSDGWVGSITVGQWATFEPGTAAILDRFESEDVWPIKHKILA